MSDERQICDDPACEMCEVRSGAVSAAGNQEWVDAVHAAQEATNRAAAYERALATEHAEHERTLERAEDWAQKAATAAANLAATADQLALVNRVLGETRRERDSAEAERDAALLRAQEAETWAAEHGRPFSGALLDGVNDVLSRVRSALHVPANESVVDAAAAATQRLEEVRSGILKIADDLKRSGDLHHELGMPALGTHACVERLRALAGETGTGRGTT